MIKYIGSKRTLVPTILEIVAALPDACSIIDLFSGTARVGHALKGAGYRVIANDHNAYAYALATCYITADYETYHAAAERLVEELNHLPGKPGYFTETFCEKSRFFQPKNGARIDAIRETIALKGLEPKLEAVLLASLMEAADRVDSTTGVQMAYLKTWAPRAYNDIELRVPNLLPHARHGTGSAYQLDALDAAARFEADVAYLDPPYNQHKYLGNYHIWETLVRWDAPEHYGIACKRMDCRTRDSIFNVKARASDALRAVIERLRVKHLVVSFNNEGYISRETMETMLGTKGIVRTVERDYRRYVGAQIGIYNPQGEKVGRVSHLRNRELIYVVSAEPSAIPMLDVVTQSFSQTAFL